MTVIPLSQFLNANSWSYTTETDPAAAYGYAPNEVGCADAMGKVVIGLVLARRNDPAALLGMDWGNRQKALAALNANGTLWTSYGADPTSYNAVQHDLEAMGVTILGADQGYTSSATSRTIWIDVNAQQFRRVFGTELLAGTNNDEGTTLFWRGTLSVPDAWADPSTGRPAVTSLWLDQSDLPVIRTVLQGTPITLPQGAQSLGNGNTSAGSLTPQQVAQLYNFPLLDTTIVTDTAAVMEPVVGDAIPPKTLNGYDFQQGFEYYRAQLGIDNAATPFRYYLGPNAGTKFDDAGERNLDVGILTAVNKNAQLGLYVGSNNRNSTSYSAYQSAIFDVERQPGVLSSSFGDVLAPAPGSPFLNAYHDLFTDAALRNLTIYQASNDGGSSNGIPNGLTNVEPAEVSPYIVMVGGTSLSIPAVAGNDATLATIVAKAAAGDLATIWMLTATGLTSLPGKSAALSSFIETAWNQIVLTGSTFGSAAGYYDASSSAGGADITTPVPDYQQAYGLDPVDAATGKTGRGMPDVAAGAGGNTTYSTPNTDFTIGVPGAGPGGYGTSAAAPLWASLGLQIQTVFEDQGLPRPGYMNDLLYIAAVVAPASFNDIQLGNNVTSYINGGPITLPTASGFNVAGDPYQLTPTGLGYQAGAGYDLVTGLGSPNGLLLARALTTIAHAQTSFDTPSVLDRDADGQWTGSTTETLNLQPSYAAGGSMTVTIDGNIAAVASGPSADYAWTDRFAQQSVQPNFSPELVTMFDGQSHGLAFQTDIAAGQKLRVLADGAVTETPQAALSAPYGFVDFDSQGNTVRTARAVSVAQTADGANDQTAIVRIRQNGTYTDAMMFYRVDDLAGTVGGVSPGDPGYERATLSHAYHTAAGDIWMEGAGWGRYSQSAIEGVNAGDLIAMELRSNDNTFFGFADANEAVNGQPVSHIWSYGLNTWGWEDMLGGGDGDYNDLVVQLDLTSDSGRHLLA